MSSTFELVDDCIEKFLVTKRKEIFDIHSFTKEVNRNPFSKYIFDMLPAQIFWKDVNSVYRGCNKQFALAAGCSQTSDIVGKSDSDLPWAAAEFADTYLEEDHLVIHNKQKILDKEVTFVSKNDAGIRYILINKVPLINSSKEVFGILGIYHDITDRKKMEIDLKMQRMKAEEANRIKAQFLQNMSHDLRTPLNAYVAGNSLVMRMAEDKLGKEELALLQQGIDSAKEMTSFLDKMLEDISSESASNIRTLEPVDIGAMIKDLQVLLCQQANIKGIVLKTRGLNDLPTSLLLDEKRMYRVLLNIVSNAIKFTRQGSVDITVKLDGYDDNRKILIIEVKDTGIGIPDAFQHKVFEKFSRATPANQGAYEGVGLGMNIAKKYTEQMGGVLSFTSRVGHGTTFTLTLPLMVTF